MKILNSFVALGSIAIVELFAAMPLRADPIENQNRYLAVVLADDPLNPKEVASLYLSIKAMRSNGKEEGLEETLRLAYSFCDRAKLGTFDFRRTVLRIRESQGETEAFRMMALNYYLCPEVP